MPGDQYLDAPAIFVVADGVPPVAVPVLIELGFVGDDGVVDAVGGADGKVIAGATIAIEVDHDVDAIDLLLEVSLHALTISRHGRRLDIPERHGEPVGGRENPCLGRERRGLAIQWLGLAEVGDVLGAPPFVRVDSAIDVHCERRSGKERE